jgi:P4 family phage/plasmid primase-like protien
VLEDQERIDYMQELLGVALIGEVLYQELPLLVGVGANGKSTLLEAVGLICGDYVATMPENFLMEKNNGDHSTELARLRGVRIALASETKPDGRFNESRAKSLTSQDVVSARFMNKDFFDFLPSHSFLVALNHPPRVTHGGEGFWRRMRKIDFNVIIPENRRDPELARNMVKREGAGILQWMIEGARRVMTRGTLVVPAAVAAATLAYREEEDALGVWLKTKTFPSAGSRFKAIEIYNNYKGWMTSEGETPITASQLIRELKVRGLITQDLTTKERWYAGLGMIEN